MIVIAFVIIILYCFIIGAFIVGFDRVKVFNNTTKNTINSFSIIIPFRDEEQALPNLLKSILKLEYPKSNYEIIFVDDASTDDSVDLINRTFANAQSNIKIIDTIRKSSSPKKDAIDTAIQDAKFNWIITTDADCVLPRNWLNTYDAFIQKNHPELVVAPVTYYSDTRFLDRFQLLDLLSLQGATIGGFGIQNPFLCNGANLCYRKDVFNEINGFQGNETIASGDDIFLLEKVLEKHPNKIFYLKSKESIVRSKPQQNFKDLIQQRIRWAAKSTGYKNPFSKLVGVSVLAMNTLLIILLILSIFGYFKWSHTALIFLLKFLADLILLVKTVAFFDQKRVLASYFLSSLIYPFFSMFVAIASLTSGYQWKGRYFKQ